MTRFLDLRTWRVGGPLAYRVAVCQGSSIGDYTGYDEAQFVRDVSGHHVLFVTHGFNVNRGDGIASLSNWGGLIRNQLPAGWLYIGIQRQLRVAQSGCAQHWAAPVPGLLETRPRHSSAHGRFRIAGNSITRTTSRFILR